jgi:hypothetical protein
MATARTLAVVTTVNLAEQQAAEYLGVSVHTLRRWRVYGGGPKFLKMGSRVVYPISELDDYQAACLRKSTSDPGPTTKLASAPRQTAKVRQINKASETPSAGLPQQQGQGVDHV